MPAHRAPATALRPRPPEGEGGVSRRRFLGYLIAAPTLVVAAEMGRQTVFGAPEASAAPIPSVQTTELYDLSDAIRDAARPTANLIKIEVNRDGTVSFAMPRSDNGQGIITSTQMIIAEEMDLELDQVVVTLADARPELVFNQLTGGSSAMFTLYTPVRVAAALARGRLLDAAAAAFDQDAGTLSSRAGVITSLTGGTLGIGELAEKAAVQTTEQVEVVLKPREEFRILGKPQTKTDARAIVTGKKQFATDLQIPDALPSVVCRAPDLNGAPIAIDNVDEIRSMPGVTDVEIIATGVAVRAVTFGHCIDAVRAMTVQWEPGTVAGQDDESVLADLRKAELPLAVPPAGGSTVEGDFTFYFKSNSSLETNCAIADVRSDSAEMWFPTKTPITAQDQIADLLGLPTNAVTVHVTEGGGSFGRKLFLDAALEAAEFSQKIGKPVKLMWTRADDSRQGRVHPMATSRVRASVTADSVLSFELRHTSVSMDVSHGFGDALTVAASRLPSGNLAVAEVIWELSQTVPYNFGVSTRLLNEVDMRFNTAPMRNVYSPDSTVARELMVDQIAAKMGRDPYEFRREFLKHDRQRAVLDKVAEEGNWGRTMEEGTAQGISFQTEYKSVIATLVEIDCRPETVNRSVREGLTGPRVTKVTTAVDVGVVINPRGIEAQILGAINDALAMTLTGSMSLVDGHFVEASWDNYFYTRQWNTPPEVNFHLVESDAPEPGGVGELGVGGSTGAIACAYARATGKVPEYFPIMHKEPRPFEPYPTVPPIPPSPTNGLDTTF
ncbi:molybdopterin cofactor-binding domain-containing protein [Pseudonocardia sp. KRD291]|uniref:molybdopterin cofactor-binding domain-containing protein n=1 Tax=Pseudonocardia sp. KRD291 TaxID=2792007 RepID=UPI001C4A62A4|nr:molybdopterin cofactor-binding domain-containing protein [Pseudonocardia sp. KRD291]MBW0101737.1 xanthine dehydrogenase family protein molybdopterin-binding subunit [Pseudonocardia sp. KRD291]